MTFIVHTVHGCAVYTSVLFFNSKAPFTHKYQNTGKPPVPSAKCLKTWQGLTFNQNVLAVFIFVPNVCFHAVALDTKLQLQTALLSEK